MQVAKEIPFGKFRLDLVNQCLWHGSRAISLRPKAFAVLKLLVENPGLLVTKQQVLDTVWPGTFVGDAVLKDNIRQLREALNDDAASPRYIETSHRRGYRFIGELSQAAIAPAVSVLPEVGAPDNPTATGPAAQLGQSSLLGRDAELAKLRVWLNRSFAGARQTVFITGEPGIGKTSIVQALFAKAKQLPRIHVAHGQCLEHYGSGEAYLPVLDGFSRLCRSNDGDRVLDTLRQHAPAWLAQMPSLLSPTERQRLQSPTGDTTTRERMLREMAEAIEALTVESPLLLLLEDLHWSDHSTLDLVSYLARRRDPARLMVIGTYRPVDVIVADHPIKGIKRELQAHGLCHELALECLPEDCIAEYLLMRFPGHHFPTRLMRTIYKRTEGNPLFVVNLVEYLTDQKRIVEEQGEWKLRVDLSEVEGEIPVNIRQLIEKQIERLNPDERTVLEAASVAGMECSSVSIAAGLENTVEWVEEHCEELARRHQFLSPASLVELPDGTITPRHRFIHVLYRDVPYRLMPPMRRSQIHHRIAERGVAIYGTRASEIAAELAMHFEQSHDWPRALEYLLQAAENAATRSAHHEAIDLANRGLEALKLVPQGADYSKQEMRLRTILSASLMAIKGFASPEVEEINARGRELFWRPGPSPELFYMLWSLNMYQQFSGNMLTSIEISNQMVELAEKLKDDGLIREAHRSLGSALLMSGRCADALDHLEKSVALYDRNLNHHNRIFFSFDSKVIVETFIGLALWQLGYPDQSVKRLSWGLARARELNHPETLVVAGHVAGQMHQQQGNAQLARVFAKEALDVADEYGFSLWMTFGLIELGWAEAELGDAEGGIEKMQRGLAQYESLGAKLRCPYFLGLLADQLGKAGRIEEAFEAVSKALTLAEQTGEGYALSGLHVTKGELFLKSGKLVEAGTGQAGLSGASTLSEARNCFSEAFTVAKRQGARAWQLRAAISMYRVDLMLGNPDLRQLGEIYSSFTEGFETEDLKLARKHLNPTGGPR